MESLKASLEAAVQAGQLLDSSRGNILFLLEEAGASDWEKASIGELVSDGQWTELNDRFYKTLGFGTGGLRGRTIGRVVTKPEQGNSPAGSPPEHPAVGTNSMNVFNVSRATQGLVAYLQKHFAGEKVKLAVSHDTRYFSRTLGELVASVASRMGADVFLFEADRSTPELSFSVRHLGAHGGVMLTASHNPPHDNGYKVYFQDGGQLVEPHASGVIKEVLAIKTAQIAKPAAIPGRIVSVGADVDEAYLKGLDTLVLDAEMLAAQAGKMKMVFTPIHGTGIRIVPRMLERFGIPYSVVAAQREPDGGFPTVKSPNPENAEALALALEQSKKEGAAFLAGTDPDADRMGVYVRRTDGEYELFTGNQIGSVIAAYRIAKLFEQGILTKENASHATLIKTFVTTDLQAAIAADYGVRCVNTLTGFKYIGEKLKQYEEAAGGRGDLDFKAWRSLLLGKSTFFVFGGEESYGYSGGDYVRDKDANAAVLMFAEVAAHAASKGMSLVDYLDGIYLKYGFYREKLGTLTFEGAEGAAKIKKLLQSYKDQPPATWGGRKVEKIQNFAEEDIDDAEGKRIPKELMLLFHLEGGFRVAVRGSGTEPKIKFYFFGREAAASAEALPRVKKSLQGVLDALWEETQADVQNRVG